MIDPFPNLKMQVSGLNVHRGGRMVLDDVSFSLTSAQAVLLTGPNGVGKSTLIRALLGLVRREAGVITVQLAHGEVAPLDGLCHYIGHRDAIKPGLSVAENVRFWQQFLGGASTTPKDALGAVGLADLADLPAAYLSAGQRRRLGLARLVAVRRPIWLLDEPTSALDTASELQLVRLMRAHLEQNGAILAATHLTIDLPHARHVRLGSEERA